MNTSDIRYRIAKIIDADRGESESSRIYDWGMGIIIILSLVPLMVDNSHNPVLETISWVTVIIFILDFIARCYVSPIDKYKIGKPWWRRYPFSFMGLVDLLSILPIVGMISPKFALFKLFRLARIAAIIKYTRYSDKDDILIRVLKKNKGILRSILFVICLYIYIISLLIYNTEPHINTTTGEVIFSNFFDAVYWSIVTLTTVGYGDIYPVTTLGKLISITSMFFGIGIISTVSGTITSGFIDEIKIKKKNNTKA